MPAPSPSPKHVNQNQHHNNRKDGDHVSFPAIKEGKTRILQSITKHNVACAESILKQYEPDQYESNENMFEMIELNDYKLPLGSQDTDLSDTKLHQQNDLFEARRNSVASSTLSKSAGSFYSSTDSYSGLQEDERNGDDGNNGSCISWFEGFQLFWLTTVFNAFINSLPSMVILFPGIIKLLQPNLIQILFLHKLHSDDSSQGSAHLLEQIQKFDADRLKLSNVTLEVFTILVVSIIIKFILDWPWTWFLQTNKSMAGLKGLNESLELYEKDSLLKDNLKSNFNKIKLQHYLSLGLSVLSPFVSGLILLVTRKFIGSVDDGDDFIFTDLNIWLFIICGLIRIIVKLSDNIQQSTIEIEQKTYNLLAQFRDELAEQSKISAVKDEEFVNLTQRYHALLKSLTFRFESLQGVIDNKLVHVYEKLKNADESTLISERSLRKIEKNVAQLDEHILSLKKDIERERLIFFKESSKKSKSPILKPLSPSKPFSKSTEEEPATPTQPSRRHSDSLHGIPLNQSPYLNKDKSMIAPPPSKLFESTSDTSVQSIRNILQRFQKYLPIPNALIPTDTNNETLIQDLTTLNSFISSRHIFQYLTRIPLFWLSIIWSIVSFIPFRLCGVLIWITVEVIDFLLKGTDYKRSKKSRVQVDAKRKVFVTNSDITGL